MPVVPAAKLNRLVQQGTARADKLGPRLEALLVPLLNGLALEAARQFEVRAALLAAASWAPPVANELIDADEVVSKLKERTDPVRRAFVEATMTPALKAAGLSWDANNPFTKKVLAQSGSQIVNIAATTQKNVSGIISKSYEAGLSIPDTAKAIRVGMQEASPARAKLIARTELAGAVNGGSLASVQIVSAATGDRYHKEWLVGFGARHPRHETYTGLDGQKVGLDELFDVGGEQLEYPGDPAGSPEEVCNCLVGETLIETPRLRAATRRWYDGEIVVVSFATGDELAGTPNHPVLRSDGRWIPLREVEEGDNLVSALLTGDDVGAPDPQHPPVEIDEVYRFASELADARRIRLRPGDFHGDGADDEVDVVPVDGALLLDSEAATDQDVAEFGAALAATARTGLGDMEDAYGAITSGRNGETVLSTSSVRGSSESAALIGAHADEAQAIGLRSRPNWQPELAELRGDGVPTDAEVVRYRKHALPAVVSLAKVSSVDRREFSGHVFNLDSGEGWYTGNTIVCGNCRCAISYDDGPVDGTEADQNIAGDPDVVGGFSAPEELPWYDTARRDKNSLGGIYPSAIKQGDALLYDIARAQKFDALPDLVDSATLDGHVAAGEQELFRGVSRVEFADAYRTGDFYQGRGMYANGTYMSRSMKEALDYAGSVEDARNGSLMRMTLKADAKVVKLADIDAQMLEAQRANYKATQALAKEHKDKLAAGDTEAANAAAAKHDDMVWHADTFEKDAGRFAASRGYDVIDATDQGGDVFIVLNRGATRVQREPVRLGGRSAVEEKYDIPEWTNPLTVGEKDTLATKPQAAAHELITVTAKPGRKLVEAEKLLSQRGAAVAKEVDRRVKAQGLKTQKDIESLIARRENAYHKARAARSDYGDALEERLMLERHPGKASINLSDKEYDSIQEAVAADPEFKKLAQKTTKAMQAVSEARDLEGKAGAELMLARRRALRDTLAEIRPMGGKFKLEGDDIESRGVVHTASDYLPADWISASNSHMRGLRVGWVERGGYNDYGDGIHSTLNISERPTEWASDPKGFTVTLHELGHRMEYSIPEVRAYEWTLHTRRVKGGATKKLEELRPGYGYAAHEVAVEDGFLDPYFGKTYGYADSRTSWEILSMGVESVYTNSFKVWDEDTDIRNFIIGLLATL